MIILIQNLITFGMGICLFLFSFSIPHSISEHRLPDLALSSGHSCSLPCPLPVGRDPAISHANMDHRHGNRHNKQCSFHDMACLNRVGF